jgi:DNA invertase Pin-like site-specific DNA recombinase
MEGKNIAVAYARVSTLLKQDPDHQLVPIRQVASGRDFKLTKEYVDRISGSTDRRPALDQLIKDARLGKFQVLIVYALDRLARDTRFLLNLIHELDGYGVTLISLRETIDLGTPIGKAVVQILGAISELERNLISERIKTALAVKKLTSNETGWRCGRPTKVTSDLANEIIRLKNSGLSIRQIARKLSISKTSVLRVVQKGGRDE